MLKAIGLRPCGVDLAGEAAFLRGFGRARRGNRHTASVRRPARHHPTAACRQFRRELQHARFVRMVFDRPPERLRLEPHPAPARCRPPVLGGHPNPASMTSWSYWPFTARELARLGRNALPQGVPLDVIAATPEYLAENRTL